MNKETLVCDHTSVGVIARDEQGRILLIERKKFPTEFLGQLKHGQETTPSFGWAPPSGHCDGFSYGVAAFKEFEEETGLKIVGVPKSLIPKNPRKYFKCRRGGEYHIWQIFEVDWQGNLMPSDTETKGARWCAIEEIKEFAKKTERYLWRMKESVKAEEESWTRGIQKSIEQEWQANPGLEPVWYEFFKELKII